MKIALINERWNGGAARCVNDISAGLKDRHEIRIFPGERDHAADLAPWLEEFAPDVVHLHSFYGWLPYRVLKTVADRYPVAYTPHDPRPVGDMEPECYRCGRNQTCFNCPLLKPSERLLFWKNRYFLRRLNRKWVHIRAAKMLQVVGVSEWLIGRMRKQEMGRFRMWHIPNGVDTEFFSRRRNARAQLGYAEDAQIILFLSSRGRRWELNPNKGLVDLADAFIQKIITRHPRAILAIGGEWLTPNHPQVRGLGYVTREMLPVWYSAASVYVLPTRGDNLPFTVLEAMACECPVVASDIGGVCEQIDPGVTGHLVPPNNPDALAEAVIRILEAGGKTEMGAAARDRVQRLFSMELFVQRHEQLYEFLSTRNQRTVQPATAFEVVK